MFISRHRIFIALLPIAVLGCTPPENAPLYFGQNLIVGVGIGAGAAGGPADVTVGVKNQNVAIVPTLQVLPSGDPDTPATTVTLLGSQTADGTQDALSTFGSFGTDTNGNTVSIGQFFATGLASQRIASGLGCAAALKQAGTTAQFPSGVC